jgi:LemA protein
MIILILLGIIVLFFIWAIAMYNGLINKKNKVEYAYSSIDVMLKKRRDLIPNLVSSVKQYMEHEKGLLTEVTELRSQIIKAEEGGSDEQRFGLENKLSGLLGKIQVSVEAYPELKANENFLQLQAALNEIEEQISASRRAFNASVLDFNNGVEMFPSNIIAGMMSFKRKASFEIPSEERENVNVGEMFKS